MRWKYIPILFVLALVIPTVSAEITLDTLKSDKYSWGDSVDVTGTFKSTNAFTGLLKLNLICDGQTSPLFVKSLKSETLYNIKHTVPITSKTGECHIQALAEGSEGSEEATTPNFQITNKLDATFQISLDELQLGDNLTLSAAIFKESTEKTQGYAIITIKSENETYLLDTAAFEEESLIYSLKAESMPAGTYTIDVSVTDIYGNQGEFGDVKSFEVHDTLKLTAFFDSLKPLPGQMLTLEGTIRNMRDEPVSGGNLKLILDGNERFVTISNGKFTQGIELEPTIKSYNHTVRLEMKDDNGNTAEKDLEFNIEPVPTILENKLTVTNVLPGGQVVVTPRLLDQAGDLMQAEVTVSLVNANRQPVLETGVNSNEELTIDFEQFSVPGTWTITSTSEGLTQKSDVIVDIQEAIETELIGQTITIRNTGNIRYQKEFIVDLQSADNAVSFTEKLDLYPNDTKRINLYDRADDGNYTVSYRDQTHNDVEVLNPKSKIRESIAGLTGGAISDGAKTSFVYIALLLFILILVFYFGSKKKKAQTEKLVDHQRKKDFEAGKKMREQIQSERAAANKSPRLSFARSSKYDRDEVKSKQYRPGDRNRSF